MKGKKVWWLGVWLGAIALLTIVGVPLAIELNAPKIVQLAFLTPFLATGIFFAAVMFCATVFSRNN